MRNTILEEFQEDGYVVIDDFLTPDEVDELHAAGCALSMEAPQEERKIFSAANAGGAQNKENYFIESGDKVRYFFEAGAIDGSGELLVDPSIALNKVGHALHVENPAFNKITFSDRVREICWQLDYTNPAVCQSMYIFKNPGVGSEVKAHQDATYLYTDPVPAIGFWIALEDATVRNGCLQFIKGSHKSDVHRRYIRNPDQKSDELIIYDKPSPIYPMSNFTPVEISKGSCIIIHGNVVHRSDPNKSTKGRHAYTFHVIETSNNSYSTENWLQLPKGKSFPLLYTK